MESVTSRVLRVLGAFSAEHPDLSLSEISRRTGLPLATAYRLVGGNAVRSYDLSI